MPTLTRMTTLVLLAVGLAACAVGQAGTGTTMQVISDAEPAIRVPSTPVATTETNACEVTEATRRTPPQDDAVQGAPEPGPYIVNKDRSIWVGAYWGSENGKYPLRAGDDGNKVGWFRPAGETLRITGERLDAKAPPLVAEVPCCYPTRFQATGVIFPTEGCWKVTARAADSELTFVVQVER